MSFGKMDAFIELLRVETQKDAEGFSASQDIVVANIRAYKEAKHASKFWANNTVFARATHLFKFRYIPGVEVTTEMVITHKGDRYEIISAEDVRDKGIYWVVLAEQVKSSKGLTRTSKGGV